MKIVESNYGADQTGLICGYLFSPGAVGRSINSEDAAAWLSHQSPNDEQFIWLHFNLTNTTSEKWLKTHLALSEMFYEALREGARSTRVEYVDNALLAVINDVLYDFSFDASSVSTLWLSADSRVVVTARSKPLRSIDRLRASVKNGEQFRSSVELLIHLLRDQGDVLVQIVRETTIRIDRIEDNLLAHKLQNNRADLGALRRVLVRLQRLLAPEPTALFRLLNRPPTWILEQDIQELRHSTEEFSTVINDITALVERLKLLQEEIAALINEQNNHSLFVLTIVTVLALPINIIAGLLGMNVGGIPLAQHPDGFWIILGIVVTFTIAAGFLAFRKR